jgi:two-component system, NarL family, sensor kinase
VNRQRWAVLALALLPLLLVSAAVAWLVAQRSQVLSGLHAQAVEPVLLAARRVELQRMLNLGRSAVVHLVRDGVPDAAVQKQALSVLNRLEFGHDGYFFVIDFSGRILAYPRHPELVGHLISERPLAQADFPLDELLAQARAGGGYVEHKSRRPSTGQMETKLSYVEPIAGWEWMLGTGTYVDEPERARRRIEEVTEGAVTDTLWRVGAIAVLCTLVVVVVALGLNLSEQRKADAKLRAMAGQIVMSQEAERARVARELHDGVSQWLVSVKYVFESALERARRSVGLEPDITQTLETGVQRLRDVLGEVRRISHDLRPALLDDIGLAQALEHLAREWQARTGVMVTAQCEPVTALPEAVSTALFRVAQEALGNVETHAAAQQVHLRLHRSEAELTLELEDDGQGFDVATVLHAPRAGLGLTHMRERIESLGGQFQLDSSPRGTWLRARFPAVALA